MRRLALSKKAKRLETPASRSAASDMLMTYAELLRRRHPICKRLAGVVNEIIESFPAERRSKK